MKLATTARNLREQLVDRSRSDGVEVLRTDALDAFEAACRDGLVGLDARGSRFSPGMRAQKTFSLRELADAFLGEAWESSFKQLSLRERAELREAPASVTSSLFPQITSQLIFSEIRRQFAMEASVFTPEVPVIPSSIKGEEVVPSITSIDPDAFGTVGEAQPYPTVGVSEEYFTLPTKTKRGGIINLTREAIHFDRTGMLVDQSRGIGSALGAGRENSIIDVIIGHVNNYSRNGTATNTYLTAGAYVNNQSSLPLVDWTDIDTALQLFVDILDPNTSEPLSGSMQPRHLVVMPFKLATARRILSATEVRTDENAAAGTRSEVTVSPNPISGMMLRLLSSQRLYRRVIDSGLETVAANAREGWWLGNLDEAFAWYEVWPLQVFERGRDSDDGFKSDVELQFKASYYGVAAAREPRKIARFESTAW